MGTSFTKLILFFRKFYFISNTSCDLRDTIHASCVKLFAEAPELLTYVGVQLVVFSKNGVFGEAKETKVGGC
jgi:hypothetical protein